MKKLITAFLFNLLSLTIGYCQQNIFTGYSINDGLSQSVVNCIFQDSKGYIWIGTQNGLNRFDGEVFKVFTTNPADSFSISNNWIYAISEDKEGNLWIGTKGGLNKYLPLENQFRHIRWQNNYSHDVTVYCYDVLCLQNGNILINTPPIITVYDTQKKTFTQFQSKFEYDGTVKDVRVPVLQDNDNKVWIGTALGLAEFAPDTKEFRYYPFADQSGTPQENIEVTALAKDKKGLLWVGTTTGLYRYNPALYRFEKIKISEGFSHTSFQENICIRAIQEEKRGNLFIGTEGGGLYVVLPGAESLKVIQNYTAENSGINHNIIQSLIIDQSENLWIGTLSGVCKTDLKPKKFNLYRKSEDPHSVDLLGNVIAALFKDDDGKLWIGNWGQGLNLLNRNTMEVEHFSTQHKGNYHLPNDYVHVIFKDDAKHIWLGTRNGILIYDKAGRRFTPYQEFFNNPALPSFSNIRVYMIIQDRSSNYWIATQNGLYKINLVNPSVEVFKTEMDEQRKISANLVYCLLEDSEGLIWIATINGLDVFDPVTQKIKHYQKKEKGLTDDFIISLCEDRIHRIWLGTSTFINVFNKQDSSFTWYSQENGLPNNNIFEIIKDKNDEIWVTTGKGLCKYEEKENTFHVYTLEDGLQSLEFNLRAAHLGNDGELLLGGMNGFNAFYPDSIAKNPYIPNLVFTSVYKMQGTSKEYITVRENEQVVLNYNVTSFTIEFTALEFTNPKKNNFSYRMKGLSDEWTDIGNRKFVPFSGLSPGEYTFSVKGSNNDNIWNNNEISIDLLIDPPWWRSTLAFISYVLLVALMIIIYIRLRIYKLQLDKKILEQKVHERTLKIEEQNRLIVSKNQELKELNFTKDKLFSIIGHDLGNQFNIILGYLEILVSDFKRLDPAQTETHLSNICHAAEQAYDLLENLLNWAKMQTDSMEYNPQNFEVNPKIMEAAELFKGACQNKNISIEVIGLKSISVFADMNMFSTILRNLIANAVKFTNENGNIVIAARKKDNCCEISVEDNGIGISEENLQKIFRIDSKHKELGTKGEKGTGLGLVLCREFIEKQNGKIRVESKPGKGSKFSFTIPLRKRSLETLPADQEVLRPSKSF